ncbi:hypothetical protein ABL78_1846 [Leptomonas seymouri]|uniref:Protein kinase domain-containing protein n=1 Tax=Leptomonas seymouri TaxID=5684 RepID=A0A0N1PER2_LEPSE|nr:hypothetical protein ABL78_1846 [Leptomonas seymouri]|eukprot:KPI89033.1 hypothetical protein ABL78_1846 [Leptomonas seymouri]
MAFFLKAIGLSDDIPGFPFMPTANDPGHVVYTSPLLSWTVRYGTPTDDTQKKVTIFTCSFSSSSVVHSELVKQLARNTLRRAKSLMIPGFLKCLGATEYRDTIYIATEACLPLKEVLENKELRTKLYGTSPSEYYASIAYGVSTVGEALCSLHQNKLVHGNVNCQSIFVSPSSGVWRLFGLELVSSPDDRGTNGSNCVFDSARRAGMLEGYRCPPELAAGHDGSGMVASSSNDSNYEAGVNPEAFGIDAWCLAGLLYETIGVTAEEAADGKLNSVAHTLSSAELRNACRQRLPTSLHSGCSGITAANPRMRKSVRAFLGHCEFVKNSVFVQYMKSLSEALLLDTAQQVRLVESLADVVDGFPLQSCLCCVLPRLGELIGAAAKSGSSNGATGVSMGPVVAPVLRIAARTSAGEDFDRYVTPVLVQMYQSADVLMRYKLLVDAEIYTRKLSSATLSNKIWPLYARGFQYSTPSVREYSARALVHLAPHLSESVLGDQVPKALGVLQRDPDGTLRTNATIALHLISRHITPPSQRASVVLNFCRPMLRDAFEPSRVAALRSLHGTVDCLTAKQLGEGVLPAVAPLTVDLTSDESRSAALALLKAAISKLEENHKHLTAQQPTSSNSSVPAEAGPRSSSPSQLAAAGASNSGTGGYSSSWGWGLFNGLPPPAPTAAAPSATPSTTRHVDTLFSSASSSSANPSTSTAPLGVFRASQLKSSASSSSAHTAPVLPAPVLPAASRDAGWGSDEDDYNRSGDPKDDDGWGDDDDAEVAKPVSRTTAMKVKPLGATAGSGIGAAAAVPARTTGASPRGFTSSLPTTATSAKVVAPLPGVLHTSAPPAVATSTLPATSSVVSASDVSTSVGSDPSLPRTNTNSFSSGPMKLRKKGGLGAARLD